MSVAPPNPWLELYTKLRIISQLTLLLAVGGWIVWIMPLDDLLDRSGTPIGGDFVMYYTAGQVVNEGSVAELYDDRRNQAHIHALFPQLSPTESWPYRYPPTVAAAMAPLSTLSYPVALGLFMVIQLTLLAGIGLLWWRAFPLIRENAGWLWGCLATPVAIEAIIGGQTSLLALACATGATLCLRRGNEAAAGAVLALSLYKPNVLWLVVVCCILARPRMLLGFLPVAVCGIVVAVVVCGWQSLFEYIRLAVALGGTTWSLETPYWKVHGLVPWLQWLVPGYGRVLVIASGLVLASGMAYAWRRYRLDDRFVFGLMLGCNALFNPYVPIYDLVLLSFATLLLAQYSLSWQCWPDPRLECDASLELGSEVTLGESVERGGRGRLYIQPWQAQLVLGLLFFGPHLSQTLSIQLGVQVFPLVLAGVLGWYAKLAFFGGLLPASCASSSPAGQKMPGEREMHDISSCPAR